MQGVTNIDLFLTASLVVIAAPGSDNILVLTRGVTLGRRTSLVSLRLALSERR